MTYYGNTNISYLQNGSNYAPWLNTCLPVYNPQQSWSTSGWNTSWEAGAWNGGAWGNNTSGTSSGSNKVNETFEEYKERIEKADREKSAKRKEIINLKNQSIKEKKDLDSGIQQLESGKESDGSGTIVPELKSMSTGDKITRGLMNGLSAIGTVLESIAGFEKAEDGKNKWNPLKCLRNVAIAVGVGALCFFSGPIGAAVAAKVATLGVAAGLSATAATTTATAVGTAIAATPTVLTKIGLVAGSVKIGTGIYDLNKATTTKEFDEATQDIGAGTFVTGLSVAGLRSISKTAGVESVSEVASSGFTNLLKNPLTTLSNCGTKAWNGVKNVLWNPWKAASVNYNNCAVAMETAGGGWSGFKAACTKTINQPAELAKQKFESQKQNMVSNLEQKISEIETKIQNTTDIQEKTLLEMEKSGLSNNLTEIQNATKNSQWKSIGNSTKTNRKTLKGYKNTLSEDGSVEINGFRFDSTNKSALKSAIKTLKSQQKDINKQILELQQARYKSMLKMSRRKLFKDEVEDFGFNSNWYSPKNLYYSMRPTLLTWTKPSLKWLNFIAPIYMLQPIASNTAVMPLNTMAVLNPLREKSMGEYVSPEDFNKQLAEAKAKKEEIEATLKRCDDTLTKLYQA